MRNCTCTKCCKKISQATYHRHCQKLPTVIVRRFCDFGANIYRFLYSVVCVIGFPLN